MRENALRAIWKAGGCVLNGWLHIPSAIAAEAMVHQGWDSLTADLQHGALGFESGLAIAQAISTTQVVPLARVSWNEPGLMMKLLDAGYYGIICPTINTRAECEAFVGACRYPPRGYRSYGPVRAVWYGGPDYVEGANDTIVTFAMIETRQAVENLNDNLSTPDLDAIYVGPADLSLSMGFSPQVDPTSEPVLNTISKIVTATRQRDLIAGIHCGSVAGALKMARLGFQFVSIQSDLRLLSRAAQQTVSEFRDTVIAPANGTAY